MPLKEKLKSIFSRENNKESEKDDKTVLLIGRTGRGKSALANVILNKNSQFEEVFKESAGSVSETKNIQSEEFKDSNVNYLIIDTPGIGDTKLSNEKILDIIAKAVYLAKEGINQVFFVTNGRFDQYEMVTYNLLRTIIFDQDITKHTTIVRTHFDNFKNEKRCQDDIIFMSEKVVELKEIINSCQGRIIHVSNPSINIVIADDEDEEEKENREKSIKFGKNIRNESRKKILEHLTTCQDIYQPPKLKELSREIADDYFDFLKKSEELEEELRKLKGQESSSQFSRIESVKGNENNRNRATIEKKKDPKENVKEFIIEDEDYTDIGIGEMIINLEDKKERLRKEIQEKERVIRKKVLKHIFNNYNDISKELWGGVFIDSVIGDNNWENIRKEFVNKELVVKWLSQGFDYQKVQKWAAVLGDSFNPEYDASFVVWLIDDKKLTVEKIELLSNVSSIKQLRSEYAQWLEKVNNILDKHSQKLETEIKLSNFISAQKWLDQNYFPEKRATVIEIDISSKYLGGKLKLEGFYNLEILECNANKLTALDVSVCPKLKIIQCGYNLISELDVSNNKELIVISCWFNQISRLDTNNCPNLRILWLCSNIISDLNLANNLKLEHLDIADNNFSEQNLSFLKNLVNLQMIALSNNDKEKEIRKKRGVYNRFIGNLEHLKNMNKLEWYSINGTELDYNSQYIKNNAKSFVCYANSRIHTQSSTLSSIAGFDGKGTPSGIFWAQKDLVGAIRLTKKLKEKYDQVKNDTKGEMYLSLQEQNSIKW